jgi:hypothetical protein
LYEAILGVAKWATCLLLLRVIKHVGTRRWINLMHWAEGSVEGGLTPTDAPAAADAADADASHHSGSVRTSGRTPAGAVGGLRLRLVRWLKAAAGRVRRRLQTQQYRFLYNVLSGFLVAREEAVDLLSNLIAEEPQEDVRALFASAVMVVNEDISSVRAYLALLRQEDYELHAASITMIAARTVLNAQRSMVRHLHHEGVLEKAEADTLSARVDKAMARLLRSPPNVSFPDNISLLRRVGWLRDCPEPLLRALLHGELGAPIEELPLVAKQEVLRQGELRDGVFVLKRGTLLVMHQPARTSAREVKSPLSAPAPLQ